MHRGTIVASLMTYMRLGVCVCAFAVFSVVSAPTLLADPIYNFDLYAHFDIFSSTLSGPAHPEHDSLILKKSLLSEDSSFSADSSSFASFRHEEYSLHEDFLEDKPNRGLHLGWGTDVEHHHHHHHNGGPTDGNIDPPADPVAVPEPSTAVSLLFGSAMVLFFRSRKGVSV